MSLNCAGNAAILAQRRGLFEGRISVRQAAMAENSMSRRFDRVAIVAAPAVFVVLWASGFIAAKFGFVAAAVASPAVSGKLVVVPLPL